MRMLPAIILVLCSVMRAADPDIRELFARASALAEQNQNLSEAIRLFGQVVTFAHSQRALAAQARYQQGVLYERLGNKIQAQRAYRAVAREFSDQKPVL